MQEVINFEQQWLSLILSYLSELVPAAPASADIPQWLRSCVHHVLSTDHSQLGLLLILPADPRAWFCHPCLDTTPDPEQFRLEVAHTSQDGTRLGAYDLANLSLQDRSSGTLQTAKNWHPFFPRMPLNFDRTLGTFSRTPEAQLLHWKCAAPHETDKIDSYGLRCFPKRLAHGERRDFAPGRRAPECSCRFGFRPRTGAGCRGERGGSGQRQFDKTHVPVAQADSAGFADQALCGDAERHGRHHHCL